jgi:hypothetical protein
MSSSTAASPAAATRSIRARVRLEEGEHEGGGGGSNGGVLIEEAIGGVQVDSAAHTAATAKRVTNRESGVCQARLGQQEQRMPHQEQQD